jgi:hypothetical protein
VRKAPPTRNDTLDVVRRANEYVQQAALFAVTLDQPLMPVSVMPWMKYFWAEK